MTKPPPADLMQWPKAELAKEVKRLRAVAFEAAHQPADDPTSGGGMVDVAGDPFARGGVVLDARKAVLMDEIDVTLVDTKRDEPPAAAMLLQGRINYGTGRTKQLYLYDADGAAALVSQLVGLAARAGGEYAREFQQRLDERMKELP